MRSFEEAGPWQIIAIRMGALSVALFAVLAVQQRGAALYAFRGLGPWSLLGSLGIGVANAGLIWSMSLTTVANTMFILSGVPFITAILGWIFIRERVSAGLWAAMSLALVGVGIMFADGLGTGTVAGDLLALLAAFGFATFVVVLRHGRSRNMLPMVILGALFAAVFSTAMAGFDLAVPVWDLAVALAWGGLLSCLVHGLFVFSSRYVQGAELTLVVLMEFILAPVWVWLVYAERPTALALLGGLLVLSAVCARGVLAFREGG